jgi:integrase
VRHFTSWTVNRIEGGYRGRYYFRDDATGRVSKLSHTWRGVTRREAEERARDEYDRLVRAEAAAELLPPQESEDPLALSRFLEGYVSFLVESGCVEKTTASNYAYVSKHIMRGISPSRPVDAIRQADIAAMQSRLLDEGLSPDTVARAHRFLKQALAYGVEMGMLESSPFTRSVRPPLRRRREPNALPDGERARLLAFLDSAGDTPTSLGIRLALGCGLRREEVCGLMWPDVDLGARLVKVRRAVVLADGKPVVKGPKTPTSWRDVDLEPDLVERLSHRAAAVPRNRATELYVLGDAMGGFLNPERLSKDFTSISRALGLRGTTSAPVTFRDLRHTYATCLVARGVDVKTVASLMGHSNPSMTLSVYAAADPAARRQAVEVVRGAMAERPARSDG